MLLQESRYAAELTLSLALPPFPRLGWVMRNAVSKSTAGSAIPSLLKLRHPKARMKDPTSGLLSYPPEFSKHNR